MNHMMLTFAGLLITAMARCVSAQGVGVPMVAGFETVGHWAFNESSGGSTPDSVNAIAGDLLGAEWVEGVSGSALHFEQSRSVRCADNAALGPDEVTVAFWLKPLTGPQPLSLPKMLLPNCCDSGTSNRASETWERAGPSL